MPSFLLGMAMVVLTGCKDSDTSDETATCASWDLIFEEDFDEDLSRWNSWYGGAFNEEIQLYAPEQLSVENGVLTINAHREAASGPTSPFDPTEKTFEYVSGRIESELLFGPTDAEGDREYRFEASIKLPPGHGMWPAFWTYGDPWPTQGEIDILEARGGVPMEYQTNIFYGTSPNINSNQGTDVTHEIGQDLTAEYHTYGVQWTDNAIVIYFDEEPIYTYNANSGNNIDSLVGKEQKIVLNLAVGGLFFADQDPNNYADSSKMEIDWVRVYKR